MTVTMEIWKNAPTQLKLDLAGVQETEIEQERWSYLYSECFRRQEVERCSDDRSIINTVRMDATCGGDGPSRIMSGTD